MTLGSWKKLSESILLKNAWWTTPAAIEEQIRTGVIWDGMTIAGWSIAKGRM